MKRKMLAIVMAFVLVFSCCPMSYAAVVEEEVVQPYSTSTMSYGIDRTSDSTADVYVHVYFSQVVDQYNVVVYLQKKVDGEWILDTTNSEYKLFNTGFDKSAFHFYNEYTGLERGVSYRIMCVSKDYIDGLSSTTTTYSSPF